MDAVRHAGLVLAELDRIDAEDLPRKSHPLLGRPSLHAGEITGGLGVSTYPDRCVFQVERRTIPGEQPADALRDVERACATVRSKRSDFRADVELTFAQPPSDVPVDAPVVRAFADVARAGGLSIELADRKSVV